jgi:hypothetical protein
MHFDASNGIRVADDGSVRSSKQIISVLNFMTDYYANGKIQVFDAHTGDLLGRKDAFIPVNIVPRYMGEHFARLIAKYQAEEETRAANASDNVAGQ